MVTSFPFLLILSDLQSLIRIHVSEDALPTWTDKISKNGCVNAAYVLKD